MNMRQLSGSVKVAILTNAIGVQAAGPILQRLDEEERQLIYKLQSKLGAVPQELADKVAMEFLETTGTPMIAETTGEPDKKKDQEENDDPVEESQQVQNLKAIQNLAPNQLLQLIKDEHPQTIAIILVHLKPAVASDILSMLEEELKSDVALRIANLDKVMSGMVEEIDKVFEEILANNDQSATQEAGGVSRLAEILNSIDGGTA